MSCWNSYFQMCECLELKYDYLLCFQRAANESKALIEDALRGSDMVFVTVRLQDTLISFRAEQVANVPYCKERI